MACRSEEYVAWDENESTCTATKTFFDNNDMIIDGETIIDNTREADECCQLGIISPSDSSDQVTLLMACQ